jgi:hypothetical protein
MDFTYFKTVEHQLKTPSTDNRNQYTKTNCPKNGYLKISKVVDVHVTYIARCLLESR